MRRTILAVPAILVVVLAACSTTQPASVQVSDAAISSSVKAKLVADPEINPFEIDVDANEGVVRLSGYVDNAVQRQEAEELARRTDGVKRVVNDIKVGDKSFGESVDDAVIVSKVKAKLTASTEVNPFNIDVDAEKGIVTLTGRVATAEQKSLAERLARDTSGVQRVDNRLEVGTITTR